MRVEELLTRWTVRLALLLYIATLATLLVSQRRTAYLREARLAWTVGCVLLWLHLAAAFHFYHNWSHQAAYEATARDTEAVLGWPFGAGVYFNYVFALVWTADALLWWKNGPTAAFNRRAWQNWLIHGFLAFMVFNATVTFADGALRWIAIGVSVLLFVIALGAWRVATWKSRGY
jgi:hypothetical protein